MIRYLICLFSVLFFCHCSGSRKDGEVMRVSVLRGPSAIAFAGWIEHPPKLNGKTIVVDIYDSPSQIQAALVKEESAIAVLPMINAANLYNKGIPYLLAGCPLWGTLFVVGKEKATTLHVFGVGTTPDILTRYYMDEAKLFYTLNYSFTTPSEITQGLLLEKVEAAVLSEPFAGMVMRQDSSIHLLVDLNNPKEEQVGFAQTAVVFHTSLAGERAQIDSLLAETCRWSATYPEQAIQTLEAHKLFAKGMLTPESIQRIRLHYIPAKESKEAIQSFLEIIYEYEPKAIGGQLPDDGFISGKP